ncbi:DUF3987 domain-containing protein [Variovorax robiniae]|uniref:DUF3987 domain-containing protein n=1 Tax=Variovorax robiniae TaxID=1836199 RepID=A0ABU8X7D3_9BURK
MKKANPKPRQRAQDARGACDGTATLPEAGSASGAHTRSFHASIGRSKFDNRPARHELVSFQDLAQLIDKTRTPAKGLGFICGAFADGKRGKASAEDRAWLALDIDAASSQDMDHVLAQLPTFASCRWWHTHSHRPESELEEEHRLRIVVELDRNCTRDEQKKAGAGLAAFLAAGAPSLKFDPCTYRPEQPVYLPPPGVVVHVGQGDPLHVQALLANAPAAPPPRPARPPRLAAPLSVVSRAVAALNVLDPDDLPLEYLGASCRYDAIFTVACAAEDAGVPLEEFDAWCAQGGGYPGPDEVTKRWNSIREGEVSERTLYGAVDHVRPGWTSDYWRELADEDRDEVKRWPAEFEQQAMDHEGQGDQGSSYDPKLGPDGDPDGDPDVVPVDFLTTTTAPALTRDLFPPVIADYAWPRAEAAGHDPGAYAMAMMTAIAGAADEQIKLVVMEASDYYESPRLWAALIALASYAKTPAMDAACEPMVPIHRQWQLEYAQAEKLYEDAKPTTRRKVNSLEAKVMPPKPVPRMAFFDDATKEGMREYLVHTRRGGFLKPPEIDTWLGSFDVYKARGSSADRGDWLAFRDGGGRQIGRATMPGGRWVENWGGSILTATTEARLKKLAPKLDEDGLFARFLLVVPSADKDPDATITKEKIKPQRDAYFERLQELLKDNQADVVHVHMSDGARQVFNEWLKTERATKEAAYTMSGAFGAHVGKLRAHLANLAITGHLAEHGKAGITKKLSQETMERSVRLLAQLHKHSLVVYDQMLGKAHGVELARAVARWMLAGKPRDIVRRSDMADCRAFRHAEMPERRAALAYLVDMGWIRPAKVARNYAGEPSRFLANPAIWSLFGAVGEAHRREVAKIQAAIRAATEGKS